MVLIMKTSIVLAALIGAGQAEDSVPTCYSPGSMATAIILTFLSTLLLIAVALWFIKKRNDAKKDNHLILETDPERGGKAKYAFDNPGFKDTTILASSEKLSKPDSSSKPKWTNWSPFHALSLKPEKKRALDDSALQNNVVKVVALKSQDFTGLGFNICGNMKEGIFIKDILHRGPAFESGKLNPGDRINSVNISFEHMVYEDALNILSYASPYEVIIEAKSGRIISYSQGQGHNPVHPIYRSSSAIDLLYVNEKMAKKKLFGDDYSSSSNYSSLQKSRSNVTTLERKESKSPRPNQQLKSKKTLSNTAALADENNGMVYRMEMQRSENKLGVQVLPVVEVLEHNSPKSVEQNQNNVNIEKNMEELPVRSIDEVDVTEMQPPQARKRENKSPEPAFERNGSGIKRDSNGIPLEIPGHMQNAALVARKNRKSSLENVLTNGDDHSKKTKGKAPSPPPGGEVKVNFTLGGGKTKAFEDLTALVGNDYGGSDSEEDTANMSSVNTIELNSSDITIHQIQDEEHKSRKTASTGDLSKMKKAPRSNTGTLERAQSLDITDTSGTGLTKKSTYDATENLLIDREPRLSLILDGLTTFQRNRLKTSAEWGNLEDAILNFNRDEEDFEQRRKSEPQFNAVMDRVIQIKRESAEIEVLPGEVVMRQREAKVPKVINKLWPDEEEIKGIKFENSGWKRLGTQQEVTKRINLEIDEEDPAPSYMRRQQVPTVPERTKLKADESKKSMPQPIERVSKIDLVLLNQPNSSLSFEYECLKPVPSKRELIPDKETVINLNNKISKISPATPFEKNNISEMCSQIAKGRSCGEAQMIKDEWEVDALNNTSPPPSMTLVDEVMDSYNKNCGNTVVTVNSEPSSINSNMPDETKTVGNLKVLTADFLLNERSAHDIDINVPDDVKVFRGSYEVPVVSHVTVTENGGSNLHSLELSINNEPSELYTTALESSPSDISNDVTVIVSRPNSITVKKIETHSEEPLVEITESTFSKVASDENLTPANLSEVKRFKIGEGAHKDDYKVEITESKYSTFEIDKAQVQALQLEDPLIEQPPKDIVAGFKSIEDESPAISLTEIKGEDPENKEKTYVTEIQVLTPTNSEKASELKVTPQDNDEHLENAFENYVKNFERKLETFESNMQNFENNLEEFIRDEPKSVVLEEKSDISKIQEIVEEQLKTLPEMRFTTSSYESGGRKTPEKRHSFEILRSNFEKASSESNKTRRDSNTPTKSRIPIATTMKTPPMSPERRDSRNLENENDKAILELMSSSSIHSTPFTSKIKPPSSGSKNVSVTSIRSNSKIPSGLPTLNSRPPIPPRKSDDSPPQNGSMESSFKQWVFNPNSNVTNVTVGKEK